MTNIVPTGARQPQPPEVNIEQQRQQTMQKLREAHAKVNAQIQTEIQEWLKKLEDKNNPVKLDDPELQNLLTRLETILKKPQKEGIMGFVESIKENFADVDSEMLKTFVEVLEGFGIVPKFVTNMILKIANEPRSQIAFIRKTFGDTMKLDVASKGDLDALKKLNEQAGKIRKAREERQETVGLSKLFEEHIEAIQAKDGTLTTLAACLAPGETIVKEEEEKTAKYKKENPPIPPEVAKNMFSKIKDGTLELGKEFEVTIDGKDYKITPDRDVLALNGQKYKVDVDGYRILIENLTKNDQGLSITIKVNPDTLGTIAAARSYFGLGKEELESKTVLLDATKARTLITKRELNVVDGNKNRKISLQPA